MNIEQIAAEQFPEEHNPHQLISTEIWNKKQLAKQIGFVAGYQYAQQQRRWIPVSERLPTKEDADEFGQIEIIHTSGRSSAKYSIDTVLFYPNILTHWRTPEKVEL